MSFDWNTRPIAFAMLLAILSATGIVLMLVYDGVWDWTATAMMATPLVFGLLRFVQNRHSDSR